MARSIKEIYDQAAAEKATMPELNGLLMDPSDGSSTLDSSQKLLSDLTTPSKVGIWRLMLWVHSAVTHFQERLWDVFKVEIEKIVESAAPGTRRWYQGQGLKFQFGHSLIWDGHKYKYAVDDQASQIVTRCSVTDPSSIVRIKVAKGVTPSPLDMAEELAFAGYMNQIKFAGTSLLVVNLPGDKLRIASEIFYDPLLNTIEVRASLEAAINAYLNSIPFDGIMRRLSLIDAIQSVPGIIDVNIINLQVSSNTTPVYQEVQLEYQTVSGYIGVDPTFPLSGYYNAPINTVPSIKLTPYV